MFVLEIWGISDIADLKYRNACLALYIRHRKIIQIVVPYASCEYIGICTVIQSLLEHRPVATNIQDNHVHCTLVCYDVVQPL